MRWLICIWIKGNCFCLTSVSCWGDATNQCCLLEMYRKTREASSELRTLSCTSAKTTTSCSLWGPATMFLWAELCPSIFWVGIALTPPSWHGTRWDREFRIRIDVQSLGKQVVWEGSRTDLKTFLSLEAVVWAHCLGRQKSISKNYLTWRRWCDSSVVMLGQLIIHRTESGWEHSMEEMDSNPNLIGAIT